METYPVDIEPAQIVRWIKAALDAAPSAYKIAATRRREVRPLPAIAKARLGDEEREDLSEVASIMSLEIAPYHASDGWCLAIDIEDEIGPRVPDAGAGGRATNRL